MSTPATASTAPPRGHHCRRAPSPRPVRIVPPLSPCGNPSASSHASLAPLSVPLLAHCRALRKDTPEVTRLLTRVRAGLELGLAPAPITEGEGGTYVLLDAGRRPVAIFKPSDEEPPALNNPKRHAESPSRKGIVPGDGALRETAAYLLDRGWAGVPPTTLVEIRHPSFGPGPKVGSVQEWISESEPAGSYGPSLFSVADVHRVGILDIRTLNTDRHDGNLLVWSPSSGRVNGKLRLVPIDHGFVLPAEPSEAFFDWLNWPQTREPFAADELEYIARIDLEADTKMLRKLGLARECLAAYRMAVVLLKAGAAAGLTLHDIASLVCRSATSPDTPCALEDLAEDASSPEEFEALAVSLADEVARRERRVITVIVRSSKPGSSSSASPIAVPAALHRSTSVETVLAV